ESPISLTHSLAFSPDGQLLAAGYDNGKVALWDWRRGRELHTIHGHTNRVSTLAFTPDGKYLVTGSHDGTGLVWKVPDSARQPQREIQLLTKAELRAAGSDLASRDAHKAFLALEALASAPASSVPFLSQRLRPAAAMDAKGAPRLVEDLDSDRFLVREAAM